MRVLPGTPTVVVSLLTAVPLFTSRPSWGRGGGARGLGSGPHRIGVERHHRCDRGEQPQEAERFLQRITEEVTASSQALNDIIWSVNSRNDSLEETLTRMRRYAAELFDNSNTICHLNLDEAATGKKLNKNHEFTSFAIFYPEISKTLQDIYIINYLFCLLVRD